AAAANSLRQPRLAAAGLAHRDEAAEAGHRTLGQRPVARATLVQRDPDGDAQQAGVAAGLDLAEGLPLAAGVFEVARLAAGRRRARLQLQFGEAVVGDP